MAFRRSRFRYRRGGGRRRFRRGGGGYKGKFIRKTKMHGGIMRPELKYFDPWDGGGLDSILVGWFNFPTNANANFIVLNRVNEGTSAFNRIGRRINMKSIELRFMWDWSAAVQATAVVEMYRLMLIYDRQSNGALPAVGDVISSTLQNGTQKASDGSAPLNMNNRDRFLVLRDWCFVRPVVAGATNIGAANAQDVLQARLPRCMHWFVKLRGAEVTFNGQSTLANDVATITTGGLFLMCTGDSRSATGVLVSGATMSGAVMVTSRLRFYD